MEVSLKKFEELLKALSSLEKKEKKPEVKVFYQRIAAVVDLQHRKLKEYARSQGKVL